MTVQTGRPPKSKKVGLHYVIPLPVYMLYSVKRMRVKHTELLPKGWNKTITSRVSLYPVYEQFLNDVKSRFTNDGMNVESKQMSADLPIFCPSCEREGTPEVNKENRLYSDGKSPNFGFIIIILLAKKDVMLELGKMAKHNQKKELI